MANISKKLNIYKKNSVNGDKIDKMDKKINQ